VIQKSGRNRVFISYARVDASVAQALAEQLKDLGLDPWIDYDKLNVGDNWINAITKAINTADGIIIIASKASTQSSWIYQEMRRAVELKIPLLPVVVDDYKYLPPDIAHIQAALIRTDDLESSAKDVARAIQAWVAHKPASKIDESFSNIFAQDLAREANRAGQTVTDAAKHSVFVVHGHDDDALNVVKQFLIEIDVIPIILRDIEEPDDSLLRRFLRVAEQASFAVVVVSPDDIGASLVHYGAPKGGENTLRYRARQNVILELGFFLGKLKEFRKVFVLRKLPQEPWPEFEMPSDLAGAIFKDIDLQGRWKVLLKAALAENGIDVR
jgi:predicted nucleotide-binding protein